MKFSWCDEEVACNLCGSREQIPLLGRDRYGLRVRTVICEACCLVYVSPRPSAETLRRFYARYYRPFYEGVIRPDPDYVLRSADEAKAERRLRLFRKYLEAAPVVLEIGCGQGYFLQKVRGLSSAAWIQGVEPDPNFGRVAASLVGATIRSSLPEPEEQPIPPDGVVALFHLLEHTSDPRGLLLRIHRLVARGGMLLVEVPDILGDWVGVDMFHLGHLFYFSESTLRCLLEDCGFRLVQVSRETGSECSVAMAAERVDLNPGIRTVIPRSPDARELKELLTLKIHRGPRRRWSALSKGALVSFLGFEKYAQLRRWIG